MSADSSLTPRSLGWAPGAGPTSTIDAPLSHQLGPSAGWSLRSRIVTLGLGLLALLTLGAAHVSSLLLTGAALILLLALLADQCANGTWRARGTHNVLVVGDESTSAIVSAMLSDRMARTAAAPALHRPLVHRVPSWSEARTILSTSSFDEIVFTGALSRPSIPIVDARGRCPAMVTDIDLLERFLGRIPLDLADRARPWSTPGAPSLLTRIYERLKACADVLVAVTLGVAVAPLLLVVALVIRLDSAGPIMYSQTRVGRGGRLFKIYKLRTMRQDAERHGAVYAQAHDPRVTRVGRILRLTRVDELPQIWNVLRGDMALIGPRPERPEFTTMLEHEIPHYAERYRVKPGLTGWAQVCFRYTSTVDDTAKKLEYDLYYLKYASLKLDLQIAVRTVGVILGRRGC